jgi:hypothetical protein
MTRAMIGIQGAQGTNATTRPATTGQNPRATTDQELHKAAQNLRDAIRNNVNQELMKANAQEAARAALAQGDAQATPTPPPTPRQFTIQGPDGRNTIITVPPRGFDNTIPPQAVDISIAFFVTMAAIIIGLPLARAFARRMDRRGGAAQIPNEISSQLTHLNQAVDAIAVEVERISEGQRFTARLLSEQRDAASQTLPSGANR